jgi:hypothetical protein
VADEKVIKVGIVVKDGHNILSTDNDKIGDGYLVTMIVGPVEADLASKLAMAKAYRALLLRGAEGILDCIKNIEQAMNIGVN